MTQDSRRADWILAGRRDLFGHGARRRDQAFLFGIYYYCYTLVYFPGNRLVPQKVRYVPT